MTGDMACYPADYEPDATTRIPDDLKSSAKQFSSRVPAGKPDPVTFLTHTPLQLSQHVARGAEGSKVSRGC